MNIPNRNVCQEWISVFSVVIYLPERNKCCSCPYSSFLWLVTSDRFRGLFFICLATSHSLQDLSFPDQDLNLHPQPVEA